MSAANNAPNILISAAGEDAAWKEAMVARLPGAKIVTGDENYVPETIDYALFWKQPQGLIKTLSNLKAIFSLGAGVDHVVSSPSLPDDLPVIRLEDAGMADQMVQYHLYAALHFMRDFDIYSDQQAKADWTQHPVARISKCRIRGDGSWRTGRSGCHRAFLSWLWRIGLEPLDEGD